MPIWRPRPVPGFDVLARFLAFFGRGAVRGVAQRSAAAAYADPGR